MRKKSLISCFATKFNICIAEAAKGAPPLKYQRVICIHKHTHTFDKACKQRTTTIYSGNSKQSLEDRISTITSNCHKHTSKNETGRQSERPRESNTQPSIFLSVFVSQTKTFTYLCHICVWKRFFLPRVFSSWNHTHTREGAREKKNTNEWLQLLSGKRTSNLAHFDVAEWWKTVYQWNEYGYMFMRYVDGRFFSHFPPLGHRHTISCDGMFFSGVIFFHLKQTMCEILTCEIERTAESRERERWGKKEWMKRTQREQFDLRERKKNLVALVAIKSFGDRLCQRNAPFFPSNMCQPMILTLF